MSLSSSSVETFLFACWHLLKLIKPIKSMYIAGSQSKILKYSSQSIKQMDGRMNLKFKKTKTYTYTHTQT